MTSAIRVYLKLITQTAPRCLVARNTTSLFNFDPITSEIDDRLEARTSLENRANDTNKCLE